MNDDHARTNKELIEELTALRRRVGDVEQLEKSLSEHKQMEEALRDSEQKYRNLFEHADEAIFVAQDGRLVFLNPRTAVISGYSPEELISKPFIEFIHQDDREMVIDRHVRRMRGEELPQRYAFRILHKDGGIRWAELNAVVIRWNGKPSTLNFMSDITEGKRMEEYLRQSEERFRSLIQSLSEMILILDKNGQFTYESPSVARVLGYPPGYFIGKSPFIHIHPDDLDVAAKDLEGTFRSAQDGLPTAFRYRNADGGWVYLETLGSNHLDHPGIQGIVISARDITERKRIEKALRDSEQRWLFALEGAGDGVWDWNARTNKVFFSRQWKTMLGYGDDEIGDSLDEWDRRIHPEDRKRCYDDLNDHFDGKTPVYLNEHRLLCKDGTYKWILDRGKVIDRTEEGKPLRVIGTHTDITQRKRAEEDRERLEEQLVRAQKLESIGTLAGGIAHDFNNLLMGIQGHASLMMLDLDASHPHHARLKHIEELVRSGADLTAQLLGFARGGRYEVRPADMNDIVRRTSDMFGRTKKEITLHGKYRKDLWAVEVDRSQMEQVFMNLYVNAWHAMPGGGEIYLATDNLHLRDKGVLPLAPGKYVKITVSDTGTGMDAKTRERIFDPFFTTKEMGRGTGLGLATVYGIIRGHGGLIDVTSEPGQGTTFEIYLPVTDKAVARTEAAPAKALKGTGTILLVDDEGMVLDVARQMLEFLGYRVHVAGSGPEALTLYHEKRNEIDLVVLDMVMPGLSGGETYDRLKEINPRIKVLLCSGYSINGMARQILERGCDGFLQKPFQLEQLAREVRAIFTGYTKPSEGGLP